MDSIHCQEVSVIAVSSIGGFAATVQLEVFEEGGREFLIKLGFWKSGLMVMAIETPFQTRSKISRDYQSSGELYLMFSPFF